MRKDHLIDHPPITRRLQLSPMKNEKRKAALGGVGDHTDTRWPVVCWKIYDNFKIDLIYETAMQQYEAMYNTLKSSHNEYSDSYCSSQAETPLPSNEVQKLTESLHQRKSGKPAASGMNSTWMTAACGSTCSWESWSSRKRYTLPQYWYSTNWAAHYQRPGT